MLKVGRREMKIEIFCREMMAHRLQIGPALSRVER